MLHAHIVLFLNVLKAHVESFVPLSSHVFMRLTMNKIQGLATVASNLFHLVEWSHRLLAKNLKFSHKVFVRRPTHNTSHISVLVASQVRVWSVASVVSGSVACQAPLSTGVSRWEHWSGSPCPPPGDLPDPGIEPVFLTTPALADGFFTTGAVWEAPIPSGTYK